jgi:hypothetical protein
MSSPGRGSDETTLRDYAETQGPEVAVKGERRHVIEKRGYNHERNSVAKREFVVAAVAPENLFRFSAHGFAVVHDLEIRFDFREKRKRRLEASPISQKSHGLADDVPSG